MKNNSITAINGIKVGLYSDNEAVTGVTVILAAEGVRAAVEVRGLAPGTRETDLLQPGRLVQEIHALVLAGGSAFGLDAAGGVVRYLEEHKQGLAVGQYTIPIVPAAVIFDLFIGRGDVRPDADMGYRACQAATDGPVPEGCVGAGTGATVGKIGGMSSAVKAGQGSALRRQGSLLVAALLVVNAFGDIYDDNNSLLAGPRFAAPPEMLQTSVLMKEGGGGTMPANTTLGVVVTNAGLDTTSLKTVCSQAHNGLARTIWPVHTMWDGDTIFALARGDETADVNLVGLLAAEAVAEAARRAVLQAHSMGGIPALADLGKK